MINLLCTMISTNPLFLPQILAPIMAYQVQFQTGLHNHNCNRLNHRLTDADHRWLMSLPDNHVFSTDNLCTTVSNHDAELHLVA